MAHKAGVIPAASFSGTPQKATVAFGVAYPTTDYAATADSVTSGDTYEVAIESKTVNGFTINLGSNDKSALVEVGWQALDSGG